MISRPDYEDIVRARKVISNYLPPTPIIPVPSLSHMFDCNYFIKCENLHPVGAFKVRGGVNLISSLGSSKKKIGVIAASTGNHGQSLAFSGALFNVPVLIYSPSENVNLLKLEAMRKYGAKVVLHGKDFDEAREEVEMEARKGGFRYVHSANEPQLIAGVGTMALEILDDLPNPDIVIVPVGAGSGACGNGIVFKKVKPNVEIIGVQSTQAPAVYFSWKDRHLNPHPTMQTRHEGLATRVPFEMTTSILHDVLDDFILVSDDEINRAIYLIAEHTKLIAEGAGAAHLAAAFKLGDKLRGRTVVGILSGGNISHDQFSEVMRSYS